MLELLHRKNKISINDYDYKQDINIRLLVSSLSVDELNVLEELLYSSIKTNLKDLSDNLDIDKNTLLLALEKFSKVNFLTIENENILIDKKARKYFEFEYSRFEDGFKADLLFFQVLLQKIPIHILPVWYSLPRTSNNIFKSIIEKYLSTPNILKRHIEDIKYENTIFENILNDLYNSKNYELDSIEIQKKYNFTREEYLEIILFLEFNFALTLKYKKTDDACIEVITPIQEYQEYLLHLKNTLPDTIPNTKDLIKKRDSDFGFVEDMTSILNMSKKTLPLDTVNENLKKELNLKDPKINVSKTYLDSVIFRLLNLKFIEQIDNNISITDNGNLWLEFDLENKALHLYNHQLYTFDQEDLPYKLFNEKAIREAEKSISNILKSSWVYFDDFIDSALAQLSDDKQMKLISLGKIYKYNIPTYTKEEKRFIKKVIFEKLFESAIVSIGSIKQKDCFKITDFGKTLFDI
ncbi:MAG: hypothetical protein K1060chlam5_01103 [Candidatus Anoxychlamydiales bacterium]|nr:hypothetical protein [Candidatus Anoxychlamydiales bacterium]